MPAAAVIPAPIAYIKVAAVKKLVVGSWERAGMQEKKALSSRGRGRLRGFLELRRPWGFSPEAPGDLPNPGIKPRSPTLQADSLLPEPSGNTVVTKLIDS